MLAAAALMAGLPLPIQGQQAEFRAGIDLVQIGVTVTDRDGEFITDLTQADFEIVEDGQSQTITYFAPGDRADAPGPPLHIGLLFDTSGSMGDDIDLARSAAIRFLNTLSDAVDMTLVDFDSEVRVATYSQDDFPRLVERIRGREPGGWTAMYDALGVYLHGAAENQGRTILLLYTDGADTRSAIALGDLMTLVRASDVTIHSVGFLGQQRPSTQLNQRILLTKIAETTGGQAFFPSAMRDIERAYEEVVAQIRAQYSVGYISTNTARDGGWRDFEVKLTRPDLEDARVQSREGYFSLYSEGQ
jgi:VWFA-related protein